MRKLLLVFGLFFLLGNAKAQPYIGLHFIGSSPINMFCDTGYLDGFGFQMEFFSSNLTRKHIKPNAFDLRWGLGFDYQAAGKKKYDVILNTPNSDPGELKLNNSHLALTANLRMTFAGESRLSPYVDGFVAVRGFSTFETLTLDKPNPDYETTTETMKLRRSTFHYGASVGAMYKLNRVVSLDMRFTYSKGSATDWVKLNSTIMENNAIGYQQANTITDLFMYRVGFVFRFQPRDRTKESTEEDVVNPVPPEQEYMESDTTTKPYVAPKVPEKKQPVKPTPPSQPKPAPKPKKPLEVKPTPAPKPKPIPPN